MNIPGLYFFIKKLLKNIFNNLQLFYSLLNYLDFYVIYTLFVGVLLLDGVFIIFSLDFNLLEVC